MHSVHRIGIGLFLVSLFVAPAAHAQKKALTQADWDKWRSIQGASLSNDGKWAAYTLAPQVGDGEFVVRSTSGDTEYRVPVGYIGRPNNVPGGERPRGGGRAGGGGRGGRGAAEPRGRSRPTTATSSSRSSRARRRWNSRNARPRRVAGAVAGAGRRDAPEARGAAAGRQWSAWPTAR